jgi:hypothetical protein
MTTTATELFSSRADLRYQDGVEADDSSSFGCCRREATRAGAVQASFSTTSSGGSFLTQERAALSSRAPSRRVQEASRSRGMEERIETNDLHHADDAA